MKVKELWVTYTVTSLKDPASQLMIAILQLEEEKK